VKTSARGNDSLHTVTPISHIVNIILFALFALIMKLFSVVLLQCAIIGVSLFLHRSRIEAVSVKQTIPILPIVGFVLILNCFRGTGEVLVRFGPFVVVRQGVFRGIYYTAVILQLWIMSKLLTIGFGEEGLVLSLSSVSSAHTGTGIVLVLYYILRIFQNTYSELKGIFKGGGKGVRERIIQFFIAAFEKSNNDYDRLSSFSPTGQRLTIADYLSIAAEVCVLFTSFVIRDLFVQL
jgi:ABC-type proline/glycine betaine transport system permease subunit